MGILKVEKNYLVKGDCSKVNQFGRHYAWSWNRNVDTDNVFVKVFESIKYFTNVFDPPMPGKDESSLVHQHF